MLEALGRHSLPALTPAEREGIADTVPRLGEYYRAPGANKASRQSRSTIVSSTEARDNRT
ncbi:hypothetical protein GCM10009799_35650 [Nocardiopsis rhodophaea]|uniref:Uncharacterized protein n=1 Tax=Nocardiopsis rhodophaea TaxID=280238 RepID=A0ABP5EVI1_9ACTN